MKRRTSSKDPRTVPVQVSVRIPYWYWEQIALEAEALRVNVPDLLVDAMQRVYKPQTPPDLVQTSAF